MESKLDLLLRKEGKRDAVASKAAARRAAAELPEQALGSPRGGEVTPTSTETFALGEQGRTRSKESFANLSESPRGFSRKGSGGTQRTNEDRYSRKIKLSEAIRVSQTSKGSTFSVASWVKERQNSQGGCAKKAWEMLNRWDHQVSPLIIFFSGLVWLIELYGSLEAVYTAVYVETLIDVTFVLEVVIRFWACPNRKAFFVNGHNLIDILSVLPLTLRAATGFVISPEVLCYEAPSCASGSAGSSAEPWCLASGGTVCEAPGGQIDRVILLGFVPVLRLLKTLRVFQKIHLLKKAFLTAIEALPVILFIYFTLMLLFSGAIYAVEERSNIPSLPQAMWLTIVTMTTVGYGDFSPKSGAGQVIVCILTVCSTLYMAIPLGIIGHNFSEIWRDRDRILLVRGLRDQFTAWGYTARDMPELFQMFDIDKNGLLDHEEFRGMVLHLKLGLQEDRILNLFSLLDKDGSGGLDDKEFVMFLFPEAYHSIWDPNGDRIGGAVDEQGREPEPSKGLGYFDSMVKGLTRTMG